MIKQENQNHQLFYICEECNFTYKEKHWAEKCETYCKEHKSCSLDITKHAEKAQGI